MGQSSAVIQQELALYDAARSAVESLLVASRVAFSSGYSELSKDCKLKAETLNQALRARGCKAYEGDNQR